MRVGVAHVDVRANMARWETDLSQLESKARKSISKIEAQFAKMNTGINKVGTSASGASKGMDKLTGATNRQKKSLLTLLPHVAQVTAAYMAMRVAWRGLISGIGVGIEFEKRMSFVQAVSRTTGKAFDDLKDKAREMGRSTVFTAVEAADALKFLSMAGFSAAESMKSLKGVLDLALIGGLALGRATDIVTDTLRAMKLEVDELGRVNDVFVGTITRSNTNIEQMGQAMKFAAPVAGELSVSIEELAAMIGILSQSGIKAGIAGRNIQQALVRTTQAVDDLGLRAGSTLIDVLKRLNVEQDRLTKAYGRAVGQEKMVNKVRESFGLISLKSILVLKSNVEALDKFTEKLRNARGEMEKSSDIIQSTVDSSWLILKAVVASISEEIFTNYRDAIQKAILSTTIWIIKHKDVFVELFDTFVEYAAPVAKMVALIASMKIASSVASGVAKLAAAIALLGKASALTKLGVLVTALVALNWAFGKLEDSLNEFKVFDFDVMFPHADSLGDVVDKVSNLGAALLVAANQASSLLFFLVSIANFRKGDVIGQYEDFMKEMDVPTYEDVLNKFNTTSKKEVKSTVAELRTELDSLNEDLTLSVEAFLEKIEQMGADSSSGLDKIYDDVKKNILEAFSTDPIVAAHLELQKIIDDAKDIKIVTDKGTFGFQDLSDVDEELSKDFIRGRVNLYKKIQKQIDRFNKFAIRSEQGKFASMSAAAEKWRSESVEAFKDNSDLVAEINEAAANEQTRIAEEAIFYIDALDASSAERKIRRIEETIKFIKKSGDLTEELAKKASDAIDRLTTKADKGLKTVSKAVEDTFEGLLTREIESFEDFSDSIKGIFFRMLAEMAAKAAMTSFFAPMVEGFQSSFASAAAGSTAGGAAGSILGPGTGAAAGGILGGWAAAGSAMASSFVDIVSSPLVDLLPTVAPASATTGLQSIFGEASLGQVTGAAFSAYGSFKAFKMNDPGSGIYKAVNAAMYFVNPPLAVAMSIADALGVSNVITKPVNWVFDQSGLGELLGMSSGPATIRGGFGAQAGSSFDILSNPNLDYTAWFHYADKVQNKMADDVIDALDATLGQTLEQISAHLKGFIEEGVITPADIPDDFLKDIISKFDISGLKALPADFEDLLEKTLPDWVGSLQEAAGTLFMDLLAGSIEKSYEDLDLDLLIEKHPLTDLYERLIGGSSGFGSLDEYVSAVDTLFRSMADIQELWGNLSFTIDTLLDPMGSIEKELYDMNIQFDNWISSLRQLGFSIDVINEAEADRVQILNKIKTDPFISLLTDINDYQGGKTRPGWGQSQWLAEFERIGDELSDLDVESSDYYDDSLELMTSQFEALKNIEEIEAESLDLLRDSLTTVDSMLNDLAMGGGATQSIQSYQLRYQSLLDAALGSDPAASASAIKDLSSFLPNFLDAMGSFGTNYADVVSTVTTDLNMIRDAVGAQIKTTEDLILGSGSAYGGDLDISPMDNLADSIRELIAAMYTSNTVGSTSTGDGVLGETSNESQPQAEVHIHVEIDGEEIASVVADQSKTNSDLVNALRGSIGLRNLP